MVKLHKNAGKRHKISLAFLKTVIFLQQNAFEKIRREVTSMAEGAEEEWNGSTEFPAEVTEVRGGHGGGWELGGERGA
jgi:hypothetical protein